MPIYVYECTTCGTQQEIIVGVGWNEKTTKEFCEKCDKKTKHKKIPARCSTRFNGDGWMTPKPQE